MIQFGGFLTLQLGNHDYQSALPTLDEFHNVYGITPDISYFLKRPYYQRQIQVDSIIFTLSSLNCESYLTKASFQIRILIKI